MALAYYEDMIDAFQADRTEQPFCLCGLRWHFWIVSDEYNREVQARMKNGLDPQRRLIQKGERVMVGVKTWGEILEENNAQLQVVKEKLEHGSMMAKRSPFYRSVIAKFWRAF